jgi:GntR family transcriptional regulator
MKIKPVKDLSLKEKIKNSLCDYIRLIDTGANDKLPREEILAERLQVSRNTMRAVLIELEQEGLIIRKHGRGTFINSETLQLKLPFSPSIEFLQMIEDSGYIARLDLIKVEVGEVDSKITDALRIGPNDPVVSIEKIFYADGHPAIFCIDRFPVKLIKGEIIPEELNETVYFYLKKKAGITIVRDKTEIYTILSTDNSEISRYFIVHKPKSLLVCESVEFDDENAPTLYNHVYYDTEFIRFTQVRPKKIVY